MFRSFSKRDFSCLKDATLELRVRTVKYFKDMWQVFGNVSYNEKFGFQNWQFLQCNGNFPELYR